MLRIFPGWTEAEYDNADARFCDLAIQLHKMEMSSDDGSR